MFGLLTLLCFAQGTREMIGRAKRSSEERAGDSAGEPLEDELLQDLPCPPPLVPQEEAEALVREIAEKHGAKGILRSLGNLPQKTLNNAAAHFAQQMDDDETPLALMDTSFLQNGKAGFLLTNRGLYSSFYSRPIWLAGIDDVSSAEPGFADHLAAHFIPVILYGFFVGFRQLQNRLLVNGKTVYASGNPLKSAFWIELLTELAEAARQAPVVEDDSTRKPSVVVLETALRVGEGGAVVIRPLRNPSWPDLERSIRALDQDSHPSLRIWAGEVEQAPALDILGGNGRYVLRELGDGWVFYDPSAGEEEIEVCSGPPGHRAPAYYVCTDLPHVLEIARHYVETGAPE
ncbi:MAG TPA: hypothetical protein VMF69_12560 [Gemmataceae bacterium]|nr:hypothetical protein [Gemmataceae bacterium]